MPFHPPHPSQRSLGGPGLSHLLRPSPAVWLALQTTCLASLAPPLFCRQEIRAMPACRRTAGTIQQRPFQAAAFPSQKDRASFDIPWGPDARPFAAQRHTAALESGLEQACRLTPSTAAKVGGMAPARFHGWRKQTKRQISWVPVRSVHAKGGIGATRSAVPGALLPFWLPACFGMRPQTERLTGGTDRFSSRGSEDMLFGGGVSYAAGPPGALQRSRTESPDCGVPPGGNSLAQTFRRFDRGLFHPSPLLSSPDLAPGNPTGKQLAGRWQTRAILRCRPTHEDPTRRGHPGWGRISLLERRRQEARQTAVILQHSRSSDRQKLREC